MEPRHPSRARLSHTQAAVAAVVEAVLLLMAGPAAEAAVAVLARVLMEPQTSAAVVAVDTQQDLLLLRVETAGPVL
jgi:hypothetical protein